MMKQPFPCSDWNSSPLSRINFILDSAIGNYVRPRHAVEDNSMNAEAIAKLGKALKAWGGQHESEVYEGAHHGWTMLDNSTIRSQKSDYIGNILGLADSF